MKNEIIEDCGFSVNVHRLHTLVIGSGAAGLNTAIQLKRNGIEDIAIITEGLNCGTSINTGSDKQTYYKLSLCGREEDSPRKLAESLFSSGGMNGDTALAEAAVSARAFLNLVNLGVKFPQDSFGQFPGYKTDHDPRQRATSTGPYTSRDMCLALIKEIKLLNITVHEKRVAVSLLVREKTVYGAIVFNIEGEGAFEIYLASNVILATGGPGGLYSDSVYPEIHTGAIGLALLEGAAAHNLQESQFGLASIKFRWNVSGTYMQVLPRFISTEADGVSGPREFLADYIKDAGHLNTLIFLKGYQWPFDAQKVESGSSIIDILVYIETKIKKRRVFLDYRRDSVALDFSLLGDEARSYLEKSDALVPCPLERLRKMNPQAIDLYLEHGINLEKEPLEIAVCAQHNNGGLAVNGWWESTNIKHLFAAGETAGTHGVCRPGGSALNSGQVAGFRIAEFIAARYHESVECGPPREALEKLRIFSGYLNKSGRDWKKVRSEFQERMSENAAHLRRKENLESAASEAFTQYKKVVAEGQSFANAAEAAEALRNIQLCFAHYVYLEGIRHSLLSGTGSRGSALVLDEKGTQIHESLGAEWRFVPENPELREMLLETEFEETSGDILNRWIKRREIPDEDLWFEKAWSAFLKKDIYGIT
ncbi:MAG: hypothetical protein A2020_16250 [Lentisphaerae bacterium GWF2_45_14]|nr:MAG: hypothetical protein A2020_16250 [Lentisphaerae bacterium GWF2_45_14]